MSMTEEQKRRAFLEYFYQHKDDLDPQTNPIDLEGVDYSEHPRLFKFLEERGLLEGKMGYLRRLPIVIARVTSLGIEAIEKNISLSPTAAPTSQTFNINNAHNVAAGNNNTVQQTFNQSVQVLIDQIEQSNGSPEEKAEAKSLLRQFLEHPLVAALASAALGAVL